jgi:hypothetical protein
MVRLGDLNLNDTVEDDLQPIDVMIEEIISHRNFQRSKLVDDIALLRLKERVTFNGKYNKEVSI